MSTPPDPSSPAAAAPTAETGSATEKIPISAQDGSALAATKDRKKRRAHQRMGAHEELNIYPMLDLMTIILVFLIKQWQSDSITVSPTVQPPASTITDKPSECVRVFITDDQLLLDDKEVGKMAKGDFTRETLDTQNPFFLPGLSNQMRDKAEQFLKIEAAGGARFEGRYAIVADRKVPWSVLKKVIFTAGQTTAMDETGLERSFGDLRLITKKAAE